MNTSPQPLPKLTFNRTESLKGHRVLEQMFIKNQHLKLFPFKLVWLAEPHDAPFKIQFGVSVSKRLYKTAVMRNRIKRCLREAYRLQKPAIYNLFADKQVKLYVMLIFVNKEEVPLTEIKIKLDQLFARLSRGAI